MNTIAAFILAAVVGGLIVATIAIEVARWIEVW